MPIYLFLLFLFLGGKCFETNFEVIFRIGTSMRSDFERRKETPGPGQYDIRKDLGGPKYP